MGKSDYQLSKLEKSVRRLKEEKQNKLAILDAIHDGIIVFRSDLSIECVNDYAKKLLPIDKSFHPDRQQIRLFKNRKATNSFDLALWLHSIIQDKQSTPKETNVWYNNLKTLKSRALLLSGKVLLDKKKRVKQVLLVIYDRSIHTKAIERKKLMQAAFNSFNGQFIANDKGFIIEANKTFLEMSGLSKHELKKTNLMSWFEKRVNWKDKDESYLTTVVNQRFWSGEVEIYQDDDAVFSAAMSISMVLDSSNNLEYFVVNIQNISDIKEAHKQIEHMAFYDGLTGLANRKLAVEYIGTRIKHLVRQKEYSALINVNLDRFKSINDAFGRITGDRFLKRIAVALKRSLREEDNLARIGGDEFIIATQDQSPDREKVLRNAMTLANKILDTLNHHFYVDHLTLHSSARIGILIYPSDDKESAENLVIKSDLAVSEAKNSRSKNKIYVYEPTLTDEVKHRRHLENDLTQASKRNELVLNYQAQINSKGKLVGAEALIRWNHPKHGTISPLQFIPIAEESRQIISIGNWVMIESFNQAKIWSQLIPEFNLSINISPIQFHEADFIEHVIECMEDTKVNPKNITLELTESFFISDTESALQKITELNEMGFKVAIDDFGTGYSSLSYFQKLPVHELKIDKSFVDKVPDSKEDVAIIESIIHLANTKDIDIVAEGVETQEQVNFLHEKSSNILIQGFFYSQPCNAENFEQQFIEK